MRTVKKDKNRERRQRERERKIYLKRKMANFIKENGNGKKTKRER